MSIEFTPENEKKFSEIVKRYPKQDAAILPILWLAQEQFGFLSPEIRAYVAQKLNVSVARIESVVSFYTMYKTAPMGKYHLQLCRTISCSLQGCDQLMKWVETHLKLKSGETSPDWLFSYSTVECIAACGGAPALQVNGDYHENMTPQKLESLVGQLKEKHE